jgi:hypothetical protein
LTGLVSLWWRDDEAVRDSSELRRLIAIKRRWKCPLALAVVPASAEASLAELCGAENLDVLVHGLSHENRAAPGDRKAEFHARRPLDDMRRELFEARERLIRLMPFCLPVFVPPWNRFPSHVMGELEGAGYSGFSAWGSESLWENARNVKIVNVHIDVIDWRNGQRTKSVSELQGELQSSRSAKTDAAATPIGILTHHLQMTDEAFRNLESFFERVSATQGLSWISARSIFRPEK